ncbi:hypothetical protein MJT46_000006 [Ovis ammon polii x Ovis aries]|nr:hypothetical protein MJT46_000006 [Ovis ammon polii x Ovis aries]
MRSNADGVADTRRLILTANPAVHLVHNIDKREAQKSRVQMYRYLGSYEAHHSEKVSKASLLLLTVLAQEVRNVGTPLSTVFMQARHLLLYPSGNPQTCPTAPFPDVSAALCFTASRRGLGLIRHAAGEANSDCFQTLSSLQSEEFNLKLIYPLSFHKIQFKKGIPFIQKNTKQISEIKEYNLGSNFHTGGGQVTIVRKSDTTLL